MDVELQDPQDLQHAMRLARAYERRNAPQLPALAVPRPARRAAAAPAALTAPTGQGSSSTPPTIPARAFKKLTPEEMAERRKLGLCFNCDEPFQRGHKCARLFYLEAPDYIVEEPEDSDDTPPEKTFDPDAPMISLSAITGIRVPDTMKLRVHIGAHAFTALLDSGSTHNFISTSAAQRAAIPAIPFHDSGGAHVIVANGDRVQCQGIARNVGIRIDNEAFEVDCYSIPLECYDMVLGITWLRSLGPILWDFDTLRLAITLRGRRVVWSGVGGPAVPRAQPDHLLASHLYTDKGAEPTLLDRLLESYDDVFAPPTGMPPARDCDHHIHLKPDTEPVAVRPYRYPQL